MVLSEINNLGLDIKNCRGQGYDNEANMRGEECFVKRRILNINPLAFFTTCGCHSWNLVLGYAAAFCTKARLFFGVLQRRNFLVHPIGGNIKYYCQAFGRNQMGMQSGQCKGRPIPIKDIAECLEKLSEISSDPSFCSECSSVQEEILSYEFVLSLVVWYDILVKINLISKV
jgi:hypothetical protein